MRKLEEDATNIFEFMASNGLMANPTKTVEEQPGLTIFNMRVTLSFII